jgi:hypothetical protein
MTPALIEALRSLAMVQLQVQTSRSAALDTRAIGVMGVDAAVATIVVGTGLAHPADWSVCNAGGGSRMRPGRRGTLSQWGTPT